MVIGARPYVCGVLKYLFYFPEMAFVVLVLNILSCVCSDTRS
jgi:hypothetical protein